MSQEFRIEKDSLGELKVPAGAYYGVQTQRGVENWKISGLKEPEVFIRSYLYIKRAAAKINGELGLLRSDQAEAIQAAADLVLKEGKHLDQFVIDVYQAGAGTSFNMNVNEVLANLAAEIKGKARGDYSFVHPNDHVNAAQSTNDSFPTAIRISVLKEHQSLIKILDSVIATFKEKAIEFDSILSTARTHLQDAVPIRLGQEFGAFAEMLSKEKARLEFAAEELHYLNIGGTAAGTGMNSHPDYAKKMAHELAKLTGLALKPGKNLIELSQSLGDCCFYGAALRNLAIALTKVANDLRLLSSGPTTGLAEIQLPPVQPGSSIMPGKVNPVVMEMLNQVCFDVIGRDTTVAYSAQAGQLQLNVMMPVVGYHLVSGIQVLTNALKVSNEKCFKGIRANEDRCAEYFGVSMGLATALNTVVGYENAAKVVKRAVQEKKRIPDLAVEMGYLTEAEAKEVFSRRLTEPGFLEKK
ncbi:MAG: aspartate ammonia-lyase [Bradymonadales bacterium]|nr:MAG: aspartate ammonia-lyase [Bradymonadales bacterium]